MSPEFLRSDTWISVLDNLLSRIERIHPMQSEMDDFCETMTSEVFREMDQYIDVKHVGKSTRKKFRNHKPFWNNDTTLAWKDMSHAEKLFRICLHDSARSEISRHEFLMKRKHFDKLLRSTQ